jgi:hypothetical protein
MQYGEERKIPGIKKRSRRACRPDACSPSGESTLASAGAVAAEYFSFR